MNTFYLSVNPTGDGIISLDLPTRKTTFDKEAHYWFADNILCHIDESMVKKIAGKPMGWKDEPIEVEIRRKL